MAVLPVDVQALRRFGIEFAANHAEVTAALRAVMPDASGAALETAAQCQLAEYVAEAGSLFRQTSEAARSVLDRHGAPTDFLDRLQPVIDMSFGNAEIKAARAAARSSDPIPVRLGSTETLEHAGERISFAADPTVTAHEIGHAVHVRMSNFRPGFAGRGSVEDRQAGAIGEFMADAFSSLVTDQGWRIGAVSGTPAGSGARRLRVLIRPDETPLYVRMTADGPLLRAAPQHIDDYIMYTVPDGLKGAGSVQHAAHANAHIPGAAMAGVIERLGDSATEPLVFGMLRRPMRQHLGFAGLADSMVAAAGELPGRESSTRNAVIDAWRAVGITPSVLS